MMRKVWYFLREVAWTTIIAIVFGVAGIALAVLGYGDIALPVVGTGLILSVISLRA